MGSHKLLFVVFDQGIEPDVMAILKRLHVQHYTRWTDAFGSGETGTKQGTPIWPGLNTVLMLHLPSEAVQPLMDELHRVRDMFPVTPGLKAFALDAQML